MTRRSPIRFSDEQLHHTLRLEGRIKSVEARQAFLLLLQTLLLKPDWQISPRSQGAFSSIYVMIDERPCYAFKGAADWVRFYFRKPAFTLGLQDRDHILASFSHSEIVQTDEIAVNLHSARQAHALLDIIL